VLCDVTNIEHLHDLQLHLCFYAGFDEFKQHDQE